MLRWRKRIRRMAYLITDIACIILAFVGAKLIYERILRGELYVTVLEMIGFIFLSILFYMMLFLVTNVYEETVEKQGQIDLRLASKMFLDIGMGSVIVAALLFYMNVSLSRLFILCFVCVIVFLIAANRLVICQMLSPEDKKNQSARNILIIGQSDKGKEYISEIRKHNYLNFNIVGYIHIKTPSPYVGVSHMGGLEDLEHIIDEYVIDEIAVARPLSYDSRLSKHLNYCQDRGITVTMLLDLQNTDHSKVHVAMIGSVPVLKFHTVSLNESQIFAKRVLDVIGSLVGMVIFGVAYLLLGPLIKIETPGPVIFKQMRVGKNGRVFEVWKFRSMGINAEAQKESLLVCNEMSGHMFKMTNDPRITRVGSFIRKMSLDELPQFYNVLKGDMSLVGTRPPTVNEVKNYEVHHHKRISVTPGITGSWQVNGRSNIEDFEEVVRMDSEYIANWSIWLDIKILTKTVWVVLAGRGSK